MEKQTIGFEFEYRHYGGSFRHVLPTLSEAIAEATEFAEGDVPTMKLTRFREVYMTTGGTYRGAIINCGSQWEQPTVVSLETRT